jgi:hypothetical protein
MITRFGCAIVLIVGAVGTATAGSTITNYNYWPNEVGPGSHRKQAPVLRSQTVRPPEPAAARACAYAGGARSTVRSC